MKCSICNKALEVPASVNRGIGPICFQKIAANSSKSNKLPKYRIKLLDELDLIIIEEINDPKNPRISLTNSIEYVIQDIEEKYGYCRHKYTFIEYSNGHDLFHQGRVGYEEYDLIEITDTNQIHWKYLWHSDAKNETEDFSHELLKSRVLKHKIGLPIF